MPFLNQNPYKPYNILLSGLPVSVIASYKANGEFIPLWFQVEINSERIKYEIKAIKSIKDSRNVKTFICDYEAFEHLQTVALQFDIPNHTWMVK